MQMAQRRYYGFCFGFGFGWMQALVLLNMSCTAQTLNICQTWQLFDFTLQLCARNVQDFFLIFATKGLTSHFNVFLSFLEGGGQSAKVPALNIISSLSLSLKRYTRIMQSLVQLGGFIITILLLHHCDTIIVRIVIPHGQLIAPLWLAGALLCSQSAVRSGKRSGWNSGEVACCCIITSGSLCVKTGELQSHAGLYTKPPLSGDFTDVWQIWNHTKQTETGGLIRNTSL